MLKIKITADNPALQELAAAVASMGKKGLLPTTEEAFSRGAKLIAGSWREYGAKKKEIPGVEAMKKPSHSYAAGVKIKKESETEYTISNESKAAPLLEYGTPGYDMKMTHPYGKRSRVSKPAISKKLGIYDRVPYLIIPFSFGTPNTVTFRNTMTEDIHDVVKRMKKSVVMEETTFEENWDGQLQERRTYTWGQQFKSDGEYEDGMVRMADNPTGKSTYFTFRVISARSPKNSWLNSGIPARHVTVGLQKMHEKEITEAIQEALANDLGGL